MNEPANTMHGHPAPGKVRFVVIKPLLHKRGEERLRSRSESTIISLCDFITVSWSGVRKKRGENTLIINGKEPDN